MKNIFNVLLLLFSSISCLSQSKRNDDYKTFNIDTFNKNKKLISPIPLATDTLKRAILESYDIKKGDSLIHMEKYSAIGDYYKIVRNKIGGSSKIVNIYYPDNYRIKAQYRYFLQRPIGIHKTYSDPGELLKEVDYDKMTKDRGYVSILDVATNMRKDFKINIENESEILRIEAVKDENLNKVVYKIVCPPKYTGSGQLRGFIYDAVTGKFIEEWIFKWEMD